MARQRTPVKPYRPDPDAWDRLTGLFDEWAESRSGTGMEESHQHLGAAIATELPAASDEVLLDLSCGTGWFARHLATETASDGQVIGVDLSPKMIETARESPDNPDNVRFDVAQAEELPLDDDSVDHIVSLESFYYYPDQVSAAHEMFRVLKPGGTFFVAMNFFLEHAASHHWRDLLEVTMHCKGADQYNTLFRAAGFIDVGDQRVRYEGEVSEPDGKWMRNEAEAQTFFEEGALLISGRKPPEDM